MEREKRVANVSDKRLVFKIYVASKTQQQRNK